MKKESLHLLPRVNPTDLNRNSIKIEGNPESHPSFDVLEAMSDGVIILNECGLIRFVNSSILEQLNQTGDDLVGLPITKNLFGGESKIIFEKINLALSQGRSSNSIEFLPENEQKEQTCFLLNISPLYSDSRQISGVIITIRDITEYRNTMEQLKKNEERFRTILDSVEEGYFELDLAGRTTFSNDWIKRIYGIKSDESQKISYRDYLTPDSAKRMYKIYNNIYITGQPAKKEECEIVNLNGEHRYFEISASLMCDEQGKPIGFRGVSRDITERKLAEQSLKESEEKYRTILGTIDDAYYEIDTEGKLIFFNDFLCEMLNYSPEELARMNTSDFTSEESFREAQPIFKKIRRTGNPDRLTDHQLIKKDGTTISVETSIAPIKDSDNEVIGFRGIMRDITERKNAEEDRKRLEAQLIYAQRMESIGTLASGIAHNFNNLLMGIQGNTSLMILETDQDHPHYKMLKNIERQVQSGSKLTGQLLGYARKGKYEIKPVGLNKLLQETSDTFRDAKKEIRIHQDFDSSLLGIDADHGQIEQILLNLFVNAADAMPTGGDLYLRTRNVTSKDIEGKPYQPKQGNYVMLEVRDTGTGMDIKTKERIFEPFFTTKGLAKGTGLGLASAYGIVKAHGGYIEVESEKEEGTTFKIYFPASNKSLAEPKMISDELLTGDETILLVDDEDIVIEAGEQMLLTLGYNVLVARGGMEALDIFKKNHKMIDMVLLDMVMPDMGGGEAFDRMKNISSGVKVLLSSGYSINGQASDILNRGCNSFIQKPFNLTQLSQKVREVLSSN